MSTTTKRLLGKAPLTLVRTTAGSVAYVYRGKPAPTNATKEELDRLIKGGFLEYVELVVDDDEPADFDESTLGTAGVSETVAWVGTDKSRAEKALAAEQAKPTDKQRGTLVSKLESVIGTS